MSASPDSTPQIGQSSGGDWQEEVYQRTQFFKEIYLPKFNEMYQKLAIKLQQHDSLPQQSKSDQLERMKEAKVILESMITLLQVSKSNISPNFQEKLETYKKQIINLMNRSGLRKTMIALTSGELPPPHMHSMSQSQHKVTQVQSHENQTNSQLQTTNMQGSVATMQQNNMASMQHIKLFGVSIAIQSKMDSKQPIINLDSESESAFNSLQHVPVSSLQQNTDSAT